MATSARKVGSAALPKESIFAWEGKDKSGKIVRGELRAGGESVVNATLRRQGVLVTKVKKKSYRSGKKVSEKDITLFTRQLATMMKAGVPLLQSFDIVAKGHDHQRRCRQVGAKALEYFLERGDHPDHDDGGHDKSDCQNRHWIKHR